MKTLGVLLRSLKNDATDDIKMINNNLDLLRGVQKCEELYTYSRFPLHINMPIFLFIWDT